MYKYKNKLTVKKGMKRYVARRSRIIRNNRVSYVRDKVFIILDDVHKLAISYVDSELRGRGLV